MNKILKSEKTIIFIGGDYQIIEGIPQGSYEVVKTGFGMGLKIIEDPIFPEKIYSNDTEFVNHVVNTFNNTDGNIGVALVGGKGLGKSFTGNLIASKIGLPIIRVSQSANSPKLISFLEDIEQDYVLLIDEFEKIFPSNNHNNRSEEGISQDSFLTFLDGGYAKSNRFMFIITSNSSSNMSNYLFNRPSRLRYYKEYRGLSDNIIREIIKDKLVNLDHREDLLEHLPYNDLNMDVLIKIVEEMNAHNKPYSNFKDFFNFRESSNYSTYDIYMKARGMEEMLIKSMASGYYYGGDYIARVKFPGEEISRNINAENLIGPGLTEETFEGYYVEMIDGNEVEVKVELRIEQKLNRMSSSLVF